MSVGRGNCRLNREALDPGHYCLPLQEDDVDIIRTTVVASLWSILRLDGLPNAL